MNAVNTHTLKETVYARLDAIAAAETITKKELGMMSRELLTYVPESDDIDIVNRLIKVLTPMNARVSILYFTHFLPWQVERDADDRFVRFGKRAEKEKAIKKKFDAITEFLAQEDNNIWTWAGENIEIEQKTVNLGDDITKAILRAMKGVDTPKQKGEAMSKAEILGVVMQSIKAEEMLDILAAVAPEPEAQKEAA